MARDSKIEVGAINIRIPSEKERNYPKLLKTLSDQRRGVNVYGDSYAALTYFNEETLISVISKYTEIDIDGEWFDVEYFDVATAEQLNGISIPKNLKPNCSQFYFLLDPKLHIVVFETYAQSLRLSTKFVEKYFRSALQTPDIIKIYGRVEADIVKNYGLVDDLLDLPELKEIRIIIRTPNPDDIDEALATVIEERLKEQNGSEYEEKIRANSDESLNPNGRTKKLAGIAAENGQVKVKSLVNGFLTEQTTVNHPLTETESYKQHESAQIVFRRVAQRILRKIAGKRAEPNA